MQNEQNPEPPTHFLRSVPALNANALQRTLHPQLITARTAWHWPLREGAAAIEHLPPDAYQSWLSRVRAASALVESAGRTVFAFVSRTGTVVLARSGGGLRPLRVPEIHAHLAARAVSVALLELPSELPAAPACVAAVGYASGAVALFDARTAAFRCVSLPVNAELRRLRFHANLHCANSDSEPPGALFAVASSGELCLLPAIQISALLRAGRTAEPTARGWTLWTVPSRGRLIEAVPMGVASASICEIDPRGPRAPLRVIAAGAAPALCAYECSRDPVFSASAVAKKAASSVYSFAKGLFSSTSAQLSTPEAPDPASDAGVDPTRVLASASLGAAWNDHEGADRTFTLRQVKSVGDSARKSVGAVLKAPSRVFRYSSVDTETESDTNGGSVTETGSKTMFSAQRRTIAADDDDADPANGSMDAATLRDLLSQTSNGDVRSSVSFRATDRVVGRIAAAPLACGLVAGVDNLGRVLVQDVRDMVVLRVLKGYRDAQVAWLAPPSNASQPPLLVVLASRINVLEVHHAAVGKRIAAFRVSPGARLVCTPSFRVFCISPSGALHELVLADARAVPKRISNGVGVSRSETTGSKKREEASSLLSPPTSPTHENPQPPDAESVRAFLEAARESNILRATEILESFNRDPAKVAFLMARLLIRDDPQIGVSPDVHVSLAVAAHKRAAADNCPDLERRHFAHQRLAESYALLRQAADDRMREEAAQEYIAKPRLLFEDGIGRGLAEVAALQKQDLNISENGTSQRLRLNCEDFIVAHAIAPTFDYDAKMAFSLQPKVELSMAEKETVRHTYFAELISGGCALEDAAATGDEPSSRHIFLALRNLHALPVAEIASLFVTFFLNSPLDVLLNTPVDLYSSGLRCMLARLRSSSNRKLVDEVILSECEAATVHAVNALLLARLCAADDVDVQLSPGDADLGSTGKNGADKSVTLGRFVHVAGLLEEVLHLRQLVAGTSVARNVILETSAQSVSGTRGGAELSAVRILLAHAEYAAATAVLHGLRESRGSPLEWHQTSAVAEAAIVACRARASEIFSKNEHYYDVILPAVAFWIRGENGFHTELVSSSDDLTVTEHFLGVRTVMLAAHAHVPDASVDAVRCLQLAEAMNAVMMVSENDEGSKVALNGASNGKSRTDSNVTNNENG